MFRLQQAAVDIHNPYYPKTPNVQIKKPLRIDRIELCNSENGTRHHTDKFYGMNSKDDPQLIIRRGEVFYLRLLVDRDYWPQLDVVSFVFTLAESKDTTADSIVVPVYANAIVTDMETGWFAFAMDSGHKFIFLKMYAAPDCCVGEWSVQVDTKLQVESYGETYSLQKPIIILFNPWNIQDPVFIDNDDKLQEYVLNDSGIILRGNYNNIESTPWFFGQFEKNIVNCAILLVTEVRHVAMSSRNNPISISRSFAASLKCKNKGVLLGKWDGNYEADDTRPEAWAGSVKILTKYYKGRQPVKYGQCWVFAGIYTTVCRALGIPCRPVTVYNCAYNSEGSLMVDRYLEESAMWMPTDDCIWHHRVWNEVWISRSDLPHESRQIKNGEVYHNWNVIDCIPKQRIYDTGECGGPVIVNAIKNGSLMLAYDTQYAYAEVNADILYWKGTEQDKQLKLICRDTEWIGRKIVTKDIGRLKYSDITLNYKYPEGGKEERDVMEQAVRSIECQISRFYLNTGFKKIQCELKLPRKPPIVGSPIEVTLIIRNFSDDRQEVKVTLLLQVESYFTTNKVHVKVDQFKVQLTSKEVKQHTLTATYNDYKDSLEDNFRISCHMFIPEKDFDFFKEDVFKTSKPKLNFMIIANHDLKLQAAHIHDNNPNKQQQHHDTQQYIEFADDEYGGLDVDQFKVFVDQEIQIQASFTNPLPVSLTKGCFRFEGPGRVQKVSLDSDVSPGGQAVGKCQWVVKSPGTYAICATFVSNQLKEINGICHVSVALYDTAPGYTTPASFAAIRGITA